MTRADWQQRQMDQASGREEDHRVSSGGAHRECPVCCGVEGEQCDLCDGIGWIRRKGLDTDGCDL